MSKDIVIDANVMRLYDKPKDQRIKSLFEWLYEHGSITVSYAIVHEYNRHGNVLLAGLMNRLIGSGRFLRIPNKELNSFTMDKNFNYCCNGTDIRHARLVFLSTRKKLVSFDIRLVDDVNRFPLINSIKPQATREPTPAFYQ
jgi:hypothetical protein